MPLPLVAIVVGVAALAAIWLVRTERERARQRAQLLSTMGFQPLEHPDPELTEPLLELYRRGRNRGKRLLLEKPFHRDSPAGRLCVFDVLAPGQRHTRVASSAVGVVRAGAGLPRFEIWAYAEEGAPPSGLMVPFLGKGMGHGQVVPFDDLPEFSRRFTVLSVDEGGRAAVRSYLSADRRRELMGHAFLALVAGGDAFALQENPFSPANRGQGSGLLRRMVGDAPRLARVLDAPSTPFGEAVPGRT